MKRSLEIDGMRTFLNTLIVLNHAGFPWMPIAPGLIEQFFAHFIHRSAYTLPALFCLSGYLMLTGYSVETIKHKYWSRCKRLLAPRLVVNWGVVLLVGSGMVLGLVHNPKYDMEWAVRSILGIKAGATLSTFWYIRTLLIFTICSPILYFILRRTIGQIVLLVLSVGWCVLSLVLGIDEPLAKIIPSFSILSFLIGSVFAIRKINILEFSYRNRLPIALVYFLSVFFWCLTASPFCHNGFVQAVQCLFWFSMAKWFGNFMRNRCYMYLCESAFFVFAFHAEINSLVTGRLLHGVYDMIPRTWLMWPGELLCITFLSFTVNLILTLLLYAIGKKLCPFMTRIMNGRL